MVDISKHIHIVQSPEWGEFKTKAGTKAIKVSEIQFTKHKIPLLPYYVGYAPKLNFLSQKFDWKDLKDKATAENCICIRFDVPNVTNEIYEKNKQLIQEIKQHCSLSPKNTFSRWNVLLDISKPIDELSMKFHQKTRYNIKLAEKKGVSVKIENNSKGLDIFNKLMKETATRQAFLPHPESYYRKCFETLHANGMANILVAYHNNEPLTAWMLFNKGDTIYYPYGASSRKHRELMASNLVAWEAIKLGKQLNCSVFDMWGATNDPQSEWWGFTQFKLRHGGELIQYMPSYDYVTSPLIYNLFNISYNSF